LKQQKGKKQPKTPKNNSIKIFIRFYLVNQNILRILGENRNVKSMAKKKVNGKMFSKEYQPEEKWTEEKALALGYELLEWMKQPMNIFFEEFLIIENDYYAELIAYLSSKFPSFLKVIDRARKIQELKLQKHATFKDTDTGMTKFILINRHDWKDKTEETVNHKGIDVAINVQRRKQ